jgi:hypothetical protein
MLASAVLALLLPLSNAHAQARAVGVIPDRQLPDSAQQAAVLAMSMRLRSPASLALTMKQELGLKPEQVAAIEALARVEADSIRARMSRVMELGRQNTSNKRGAMVVGMGWTDPIDEGAIRAAACEQARGQADILIGMMRDRHALGVLLTADQQHQFDELQGQMMVRAIRAPQK